MIFEVNSSCGNSCEKQIFNIFIKTVMNIEGPMQKLNLNENVAESVIYKYIDVFKVNNTIYLWKKFKNSFFRTQTICQ